MSEYTIEKISQDEPRRYEGQNGVVYYIKTKLSGHDKAVSIGKKSPDALKVGDVLHGTITETQYDADKFTADKPAMAGGFAGKQPSPPRDDSAIQAQWSIGQAVHAATALNTDGNLNLVEVEAMAKKFFAMIDRVKTGDKTTEEPVRDWSSVGKPKQDEVHTGFDDSEPVNLDDIPF